MKNLAHGWWFCSLGAAAATCVILLTTHFWGMPWWVSSDSAAIGWTIYPPLSALPQAIPSVVDEQNLTGALLYPGLLKAGWVAGAFALALWLVALAMRMKFSSLTQLSRKVFVLPLVLLLPLLVHVAGINYREYQSQHFDGPINDEQIGNVYRVYGKGHQQTDSITVTPANTASPDTVEP